MSLFFYRFFIILYGLAIRMASLWNTKARLWIRGRRIFPDLSFPEKTLWMHCASLGEFEQGRPVLESIKKEYPSLRVVVSFFSPSGYEIRKHYPLADAVIYLPVDTPANAAKLVEQINPALVIWVKYEYWHHHLQTIRKKKIPLLLISGIFRPNQPFFQWYGKLWRKSLDCFDHFFVQDEKSRTLLGSLVDESKITLSGDTRFDRVLEIAIQKKPLPEIDNFIRGRKCLVAGSTWSADEKILKPFVQQHPEHCFILAPHEIGREHLDEIRKSFPNAVFFSELNNNAAKDSNVLIIDNIGMLSSLYAHGDLAWIGGGFGSGIHNILEASVYGLPVVFGPRHEKFAEAVELTSIGGAFSVNDAMKAIEKLEELMRDENLRKQSGEIAGAYVRKKAGATKMILDHIMLKRLLTR